MSCPICEKNKFTNTFEVFRNEYIVVSHAPLDANLLGYIYIEPIEHYENWSDIPLDVLNDVQRTIKKIDLLLRKENLAERVYSVTISEMVRHIHFHIIPRRQEMEIKGVDLIEKATQQISSASDKTISIHQLTEFIEKAKHSLLI